MLAAAGPLQRLLSLLPAGERPTGASYKLGAAAVLEVSAEAVRHWIDDLYSSPSFVLLTAGDEPVVVVRTCLPCRPPARLDRPPPPRPPLTPMLPLPAAAPGGGRHGAGLQAGVPGGERGDFPGPRPAGLAAAAACDRRPPRAAPGLGAVDIAGRAGAGRCGWMGVDRGEGYEGCSRGDANTGPTPPPAATCCCRRGAAGAGARGDSAAVAGCRALCLQLVLLPQPAQQPDGEAGEGGAAARSLPPRPPHGCHPPRLPVCLPAGFIGCDCPTADWRRSCGSGSRR